MEDSNNQPLTDLFFICTSGESSQTAVILNVAVDVYINDTNIFA